MKKLTLFIASCFFSFVLHAQKNNFAVGPAIHFPVGKFSETHFIGISTEAMPAKFFDDSLAINKMRFIYKGGAAYFFGKKEVASGFPYKYRGYTVFYVQAGLGSQLLRKVNFQFLIGPALGVYNGSGRFTFSSDVNISYLLHQRISVGPAAIILKESDSNALLSLALRLIYKY